MLCSGRYRTTAWYRIAPRRGIPPRCAHSRVQLHCAANQGRQVHVACCMWYHGVSPAQQIKGAKSVEDLQHDARHADATYKLQHAPYGMRHNDTAGTSKRRTPSQHSTLLVLALHAIRKQRCNTASASSLVWDFVRSAVLACFPLYVASRTATTAGGWLSSWRASSVPMHSASSMR